MKLRDIEKDLNTILNTEAFIPSDPSLNGVQVGDLDREINKIALLVDASLEGFRQAKKNNADLIIVHHGLFWGKPIAIKGSHYNRVQFLIENKIALYACHLPLDANMLLGNNIGIAKRIGLESIEQFGKYKGNLIGVKGELSEPKQLDDIKKMLLGDNEPAYMIPGGNNLIKTIAIVSGGSPFSVLEAISQNIDLFITGDKSHEVYHTCIEEGINMICAGHYATETFGVKLIGEWIKDTMNIETVFIDLPTGA